MRKIFLARRNALFSSTSISIGGVLLVVAVFFVVLRFALPGTLLYILSPVLFVGSYVSSTFSSVTSGFRDATLLAEQNAILDSQNNALRGENQILTAKVEDLITLMGTESRKDPGTIAGVILRPPESPYDVLIVGGGSDADLHPGMRVFAEGGIPIGTIETVTEHTSRVLLFSAHKQKTNAWVGASRTPVFLEGKGGGAFEASVPASSESQIGDIVYIAGPGSLPIGVVKQVVADPSSPSVTLRIQSFVNIFSITTVLIRP